MSPVSGCKDYTFFLEMDRLSGKPSDGGLPERFFIFVGYTGYMHKILVAKHKRKYYN